MTIFGFSPHVATPIALAVGLEVAAIWFPKYHDKIEETQHALIGYGLLAASKMGGAQQQPQPQAPIPKP